MRSLSLVDLTLLGIGGTLGSGLFLLTGSVARNIAGPAITLSFALGAVVCMLSAMSYAEMASRYPTNGGAYSYSYVALGEWPAFLVSMCLTLEYGVATAAIARSWASYSGDILVGLPGWATGIESRFCVLAFLFVGAVAALLSVGLEHAKWVINTGTILYAAVAASTIGFGAGKVDVQNWSPFLPFGLSGVLTGASTVFYAYLGFDEIAILAEEAISPSSDVPLAMLLTLFFVTTVYMLASLILTGVMPYQTINIDSPFPAAMRTVGLPVVAKIISIGIALGMSNTGLVAFAAQPRLFVSMACDALLPPWFARNLSATTLGCGAFFALLALVIRTEALVDVVSGGTLLAFSATNLSLLLTRSRLHASASRTNALVCAFAVCSGFTAVFVRLQELSIVSGWTLSIVSLGATVCLGLVLMGRDFIGGSSVEERPPLFLCPWVPVLPLIGMFSTLFFFFQLPHAVLSTIAGLMTITTVFYIVYGVRKSSLEDRYVEITRAT